MSFRNIVLLFMSVGTLYLFVGCASFREGNVPRAQSSSRRKGVEGKSISVQVYGAVILNGDIYQAHPETWEDWSRYTINAYEDSAMFSTVRESGDKADLEAEVVVVDRGDPNRLFARITGLTLYIIPSKVTHEITVKTTIRDGDGNTLGAFEKSETVTLWQQLLLVFAMPFNLPESVNREAVYDLNHATIKEAHGLGIL